MPSGRGNGALIAGTIAVDKWLFEPEEKANPPRLYFLSHFHSDHIAGLNSSWTHPIYTSPLNCRLVKHFVNTDPDLFIPLELNKDHVLNLGDDDEPKVIVTLLDANHVPGAVMFLFQGFFGNVLYTADFRFDHSCLEQSTLKAIIRREDLDLLYLDNTFFFSSCTFGSRKDVLERLVTFVKRYPQYQIYIGIRKLGKEDVLVEVAKALEERILVSEERMQLLETLRLPNVFTTRPEDSRIHAVYMSLLKKNFMISENAKRPTIGIMLTALFYGWDGGPYSMSDEYGLHVFEYSDHSSYPELSEAVRMLKPRRVIPIVADVQAAGFMKDWPEFHTSRVDMSPLNPLLSKMPVKLLPDPPKLKTPAPTIFQITGRKRRRSRARFVKEYIYRGPMGAVYPNLSSDHGEDKVPAKALKHDKLVDALDTIKQKTEDVTEVSRRALSRLRSITEELKSHSVLITTDEGISKATIAVITKKLINLEKILEDKSNGINGEPNVDMPSNRTSSRFTEYYHEHSSSSHRGQV